MCAIFSQNLFFKYQNSSDVEILKNLTLWTLKNSQSCVTLKNECKQLRYYIPYEIKNSTYPNEKILRLKQQAKFKTIHKNIFINIFVFKDRHRKKTPSNKSAALRKSTNICAWAVGTLNQLFIRGS